MYTYMYDKWPFLDTTVSTTTWPPNSNTLHIFLSLCIVVKRREVFPLWSRGQGILIIPRYPIRKYHFRTFFSVLRLDTSPSFLSQICSWQKIWGISHKMYKCIIQYMTPFLVMVLSKTPHLHLCVFYTRVCTTWLRLFRMNRTNNFDQSL
jgi:hypothetical protein